jgi:hypothetical protein
LLIFGSRIDVNPYHFQKIDIDKGKNGREGGTLAQKCFTKKGKKETTIIKTGIDRDKKKGS